ncbi:hypothetical protein FN846DRAFT_476168 [Sphaerosporella brunnea]|uniref:Uncharacterized protein n=1 Tax=Sphaerosporella brunnea TaxID=1250544 RepID=A0A5J5EFG5_9PEZI|nr:hypothetical protein FN846DRAFT_476168 [Sphaerosporella brunnea]
MRIPLPAIGHLYRRYLCQAVFIDEDAGESPSLSMLPVRHRWCLCQGAFTGVTCARSSLLMRIPLPEIGHLYRRYLCQAVFIDEDAGESPSLSMLPVRHRWCLCQGAFTGVTCARSSLLMRIPLPEIGHLYRRYLCQAVFIDEDAGKSPSLSMLPVRHRWCLCQGAFTGVTCARPSLSMRMPAIFIGVTSVRPSLSMRMPAIFIGVTSVRPSLSMRMPVRAHLYRRCLCQAVFIDEYSAH